ncbi:hypothetical protein KM043_018106 [Ampulex compressa]|nr:hypothetical protein KM043_018106 [Ampulex compressa]
MDEITIECTFAVVGGGIAGASCTEGLGFLAPNEKTVLITASPMIKTITNILPLGKTLMQFDVKEKSTEAFVETHISLQVIHDVVIKIDPSMKLIYTQTGKTVKYKMLCLCNGASPKLIAKHNDFVIGIRDTESVTHFLQKIHNARKIIVVGNGGIATEIIHEVKDIEMIWVIKDKHISATFVDPGAAEFFCDKLQESNATSESENKNHDKELTKRIRYEVSCDKSSKEGAALGPDWHNNFDMKGKFLETKKVCIEYESEVIKVHNTCKFQEFGHEDEWPVYAELTNGKIIGCDFIVSATGVVPNSNIDGLEKLDRGVDEGFLVDWKLQTSERDIYAAGDVCTAGWTLAEHWFQMRLWTQAHHMGFYAAKSLVSSLKNEEFLQDFCFELFTHVTKFFGYKVVLLGLYNGQKLQKNYEILLRMTKGKEYIKLILVDGKMQGAVLIGDTDLEEMCENLILNQLDLSMYGEDLLNPDIDVEDYFD